jgi:hypothetical protein
LDLLPAIMHTEAEVFIERIENEALSWTAYLNPLSMELWLLLIIVSILTSSFLTIIERFFIKSITEKLPIFNFLKNLWVTFKANFGGKPNYSVPANTTHKIIMFECLLVGSIIWMAYRASLTSELSVKKMKLPFNSLESLLTSDYE